jgi:lysophospholipase L1-like esterase
LRKAGFRISDPDVIAVTGWSTVDLISALEKITIGKRYDIVSLLIGVNNEYQKRSMDEYEKEFRYLVQQAISFGAGKADHVFILSIPDYSVTPFAVNLQRSGIQKSLQEFNEINSRIALENHVHYIEITEGSRKAGGDPALLASDGLHFSGREYFRWASLLASSIRQAGILS